LSTNIAECALFVVGYRPPCKVQSELCPRRRKSSSKCLEAMFEGAEPATAGAVSDQDAVQKRKCFSVESRQMSSTPIDLNANELHYPPVSSS